MNGGGVINGMVGPGRGAGAAKLGGGLPCLPTPFPLLLSAPCHLGGGGVFLPPTLSPAPKGPQAGLPTDPWQPRGGRTRGAGTGLKGQSWLVLGLWAAGD